MEKIMEPHLWFWRTLLAVPVELALHLAVYKSETQDTDILFSADSIHIEQGICRTSHALSTDDRAIHLLERCDILLHQGVHWIIAMERHDVTILCKEAPYSEIASVITCHKRCIWCCKRLIGIDFPSPFKRLTHQGKRIRSAIVILRLIVQTPAINSIILLESLENILDIFFQTPPLYRIIYNLRSRSLSPLRIMDSRSRFRLLAERDLIKLSTVCKKCHNDLYAMLFTDIKHLRDP